MLKSFGILKHHSDDFCASPFGSALVSLRCFFSPRCASCPFFLVVRHFPFDRRWWIVNLVPSRTNSGSIRRRIQTVPQRRVSGQDGVNYQFDPLSFGDVFYLDQIVANAVVWDLSGLRVDVRAAAV